MPLEPAGLAASTPDVRLRHYTWSDPAVSAAQASQLSGLEFLRAVIDGHVQPAPIGETLGFSLSEASAGRVVFVGTPAEWQYNPIGSVHGGVFCTLLDSAMGCAVHSVLEPGLAYTSLDISVRLNRGMSTSTGPVRAIGEVMHAGRRTATARAELRDSADRLLATGTSTCLITPIPAP